MRFRLLSIGVLVSGLLVGGCSTVAVPAAIAVGRGIGSGIEGAVDATRTPSERVRRTVGPDCATWTPGPGGPVCTRHHRDPDVFGISNRPRVGLHSEGEAPPRPGEGYADCLYRKVVEVQNIRCD
jgi:hypothetical protein